MPDGVWSEPERGRQVTAVVTMEIVQKVNDRTSAFLQHDDKQLFQSSDMSYSRRDDELLDILALLQEFSSYAWHVTQSHFISSHLKNPNTR